ncbi:hypothetical protein DFP72DRAFT_855687 [Ephemerocybe angulata]|uniref:Uncharacterized protein n=1 Tax=Ephemerocybe angulata TaxID=980116 RepID=A0A8H6LZA7_9AGAR|nr:hypothetical protein DFP72DRAFT_855687 [Tulosesus angulatus]
MTSNNVAHRRHGAPQFQTLFVGTTVGRKTTRRNPRPLEMGTKVEQKEGSPASQVLMAGSSTQFRGGCYHPAFNTLNFGLTEYPGHRVDLIALDPPLANNPPAWIHRNTTREPPHAQDAGATEVLQDVEKTLDGAAEVEVKPARERELDKYIKGTSRSVRNQMRLARQGVRGSGYNNLTPGDGTTQKKWRLLDANLKAKIEEFAIPTPPAPQNSNSECHPAPNQTAAPPRPATTALC